MRKIEVLKKNYDRISIDSVAYIDSDGTKYTYAQVFATPPPVYVTPPSASKMEYMTVVWDKIKNDIDTEGKVLKKSGATKFDLAYTNKTIDEVVHEGLSLRDIFEVGNLVPQPDLTGPVRPITPTSAFWELNLSTGVNLSLHLSSNFYLSGMARADILTGNANFTTLRFTSGQIPNGFLEVAPTNTTGLNNDFSFVFDTLDTVRSNPIPSLMQYWTAPATFTGTVTQKDTHLINMNIFTVQPTQAQMDTWRDMYLARKGITKQHLTYADVFEVNNMIVNPHFDINTTGWIGGFGTFSVANGVAELVADGTQPWPQIQQDINLPVISGEKLYISSKFNMVTGGKLAVHLRTPGIEGIIDIVIPLNTWNDFSRIHTVVNSNATPRLNFINAFPTAAEANGAVSKYDDVFIINMSNFDELASQAILDSLRAQYLLIKDHVIIPELYVITEPLGFGKRYRMLELNKQIYGHELDFQKMTFKMNFGVNYNAYMGYNLVVTALKGNEAVIAYDWGIGVRYADVRLLEAPKTEKDTTQLLISKFAFELSNPFYNLIVLTGTGNITFINTHSLEVDYILEFTPIDKIVSLTAEESGLVKFNFPTIPTQNVVINSRKKTILFADGTNAYQFVDFNHDAFFTFGEGYHQIVTDITRISAITFTYKQWVVD